VSLAFQDVQRDTLVDEMILRQKNAQGGAA
jgi:hypothetical protein